MKGKLIRSIFWITVAVFFAVILNTFIPIFLKSEFSILINLPAWILLMALGIALIVLTLKKKTSGKSRLFLLLTGASAAGFLVFVILHNLVSALFSFEEAILFIIAVIICPVAFLTGAIGTVTLTIKYREAGRSNQYSSGGESN